MKKNYRQPLIAFGVSQLIIISVVFYCLAAAADDGQQSSAQGLLSLNEKWRGDFDGMVERREIRALVVYSKTFYFLDQGRQRGVSYELLKEFEKFVKWMTSIILL